MAGALIVTAELAPQDFAWLDQQRRTHFPPARNQLGAHLTMFHALPPSLERQVCDQLKSLTRAARPSAMLSELINLGGGVAYRVRSEALDSIRSQLADHFQGSLSAQDGAGWRAHVTIQNKVSPAIAKALIGELAAHFRPRPLSITGLGLHRYLDGPWDPIGTWSFRA